MWFCSLYGRAEVQYRLQKQSITNTSFLRRNGILIKLTQRRALQVLLHCVPLLQLSSPARRRILLRRCGIPLKQGIVLPIILPELTAPYYYQMQILQPAFNNATDRHELQ